MIEPLEGVEVLLLKACQLAKETNNVKDFNSASFKNFIKAKENYDFINKNLFSNNDSN